MSDNIFTRACSVGSLFFIGFASQNGGYELRNKFGKRSLGNKDISVQCDIEDMSSVYASYNDVNDWLVATK